MAEYYYNVAGQEAFEHIIEFSKRSMEERERSAAKKRETILAKKRQTVAAKEAKEMRQVKVRARSGCGTTAAWAKEPRTKPPSGRGSSWRRRGS